MKYSDGSSKKSTEPTLKLEMIKQNSRLNYFEKLWFISVY